MTTCVTVMIYRLVLRYPTICPRGLLWAVPLYLQPSDLIHDWGLRAGLGGRRWRLSAGRRLFGASPPTICATSWRSSSVISSGPKPGIEPGSVKSQSFSASPMKSRSPGRPSRRGEGPHGSSPPARPDARKARMSVAAVIDSSDGSLREIERQLGAERRRRRPDVSRGRSVIRECARVGTRLRRRRWRGRFLAILDRVAFCGATSAHRNFSGSLIRLAPFARPAACQRLRIGAVALALVERPLDMVLGDEGRDRVARTGSGIGTGSTRSLPASVKASPSAGSAVTAAKLVGRLDSGRAQHHPQRRRAGCEIVAIVRGLGAIAARSSAVPA